MKQWQMSPDGILAAAQFSAQILLDQRKCRREQRMAYAKIQQALQANWSFKDIGLTVQEYLKIRQRILGVK